MVRGSVKEALLVFCQKKRTAIEWGREHDRSGERHVFFSENEVRTLRQPRQTCSLVSIESPDLMGKDTGCINDRSGPDVVVTCTKLVIKSQTDRAAVFFQQLCDG